MGGAGANHENDSSVVDEEPLEASLLWFLQLGGVLTVNIEGTDQKKDEKYSEKWIPHPLRKGCEGGHDYICIYKEELGQLKEVKRLDTSMKLKTWRE